MSCVAARIYFAAMAQFLSVDVPLVAYSVDCAVVAGISAIVVIVLARPRDLKAIGETTIFGIVGAAFGISSVSGYVVREFHGYDHGFGETAAANLVCGIGGAGAGFAIYFAFQLIAIARQGSLAGLQLISPPDGPGDKLRLVSPMGNEDARQPDDQDSRGH